MKTFIILCLFILFFGFVCWVTKDVQQSSQEREVQIVEAAARHTRILGNTPPPVISPEGYVAIGIFLIQHNEFGSSRIRQIKLVGTISSGVTAYNVTLINSRELQFWFKNDLLILVGEEVSGGFVVHYGE